MNRLALVQSLHREAGLPGSAPASTAGQSGRPSDLIRWIDEAWNDIQRDRDGKWKWLRGDFTLDTVADTPAYAYTDCIDVSAGSVISRFRSWYLDSRELPFIYLVSDGEASETELAIADWTVFRRMYVRGTHETSAPNCIAVDPSDNLYLGPTPNGIYRLSGSYWKSNQILAEDNDIPEMPADYHMIIVYMAMVKYGYTQVAQEILARATTEGERLYDQLVLNQSFSRFSWSTADALA